MSVVASPYADNKALVFFDTKYTAGSYAAFFPEDIGYVRCNANGSSPGAQSVFARGVSLAARPVGYADTAGFTNLAVTGVLLSSLQPTVFVFRFGSSLQATNGFGTIAAGTHTSPRVLARLSPAVCYNINGTRNSGTRLATPLAVV